jgi:RNA polymerase sigma-70 factor (ECF subfamily)
MQDQNLVDPTDPATGPVSPLDPDRWVDDHADFLYRYALLRVRHREVAQDLLQETMLAALKNREGFGGRSSERSWLCGILKNKVCDYFRKLGRETAMTDLDGLSGEFAEKFVDGGWIHVTGPKEWKPASDEILHRAEFWATLRGCLGKVPERIANVFVLREVDGLTSKEVCELAAISETNLGVMLHRARMALRECLELNWFDHPAKNQK